MTETKQKRVRKSPEDRRAEITRATVRLIGERGYYGTSLKDIADAVNMSQPGLLHYIGNKEGLLSMLIADGYDTHGTPEDFMRSGLPGSDPDRLLFPSYLRYLVRYNSQRREQVQMYMRLEAESLSPDHPLYDYFDCRGEAAWDYYSRFQWCLPPQVGSWEESMKPLVRRCLEAMDGVQLRWLRRPPVDLYDEWLAFEMLLFPSPTWDNYR
ncbi:TetR/AcrR family transcriptional regulator [Bifidobacterium amazonense]|uniref:TetR/AcrR family transcriptional regulator n=1 Tax=Bifidobacterium amazonense TaxID=2809027 RepID=A0ABS9VW01_9BIFI|nr:TetR/AcrR family transcriptional regulator [Bifidobacterium amazonense]MCH9276253.1 TetR/AcrR family transcriptional regulator [Bifidobacterium amazonense]